MWFRGNVTRRPPASDSTLEDSDISIDHAIIADLEAQGYRVKLAGG